jgi:hypothetical protein
VVKVTAGELRLGHAGVHSQVRLVRRAIIHESYNHTGDTIIINDLAILVLSHPFVYGEYVYPIRIPPQNQTYAGEAEVCGWGRTEASGDSSKVLLKAKFQVLTEEQCEEQLFDYLANNETSEAKEQLRQAFDEAKNSDDYDDPNTTLCVSGHTNTNVALGLLFASVRNVG